MLVTIFLVLIILFFLSTMLVEIDGQLNNNFSFYESHNGMKIKYPSEWVEKEDEMKNQITFFPPRDNNTLNSSTYLTLSVDTIFDERTDLYDYVDEKDLPLKYEQSNLTDIKILKSDYFTIKGYPIYKFEFTANENQKNIRVIENILIKGDKAFSIVYFAELSVYYKYLTTIQNIISSFIDTISEPLPTESAGIIVDGNPKDVSVNPNTNTIYIIDDKLDKLLMIDGSTDKLISTLKTGNNPTAMIVNPHNNTLFVINDAQNNNTISLVNGKNNKITSNITVNEETFDIVKDITIDQKGTLYVADSENGIISAIPTQNNEDEEEIEIKSIYLGEDYELQGIDTNINTDSGIAYVIADLDIADADNTGTLLTIDTKTEQVISSIKIGDSPEDIVINPYTDMIYVTDRSGQVFVIDSSTSEQVANITIERGAENIAINPNTNKVYVTNAISHKVTVIDELSNKIVAVISAGEVNRGEFDSSEDKIAVNPNTNMVYLVNENSNLLYSINGSANSLVAGVNFTINPSNSGEIYCNDKKVSNTYQRFEVGGILRCEVFLNKDFKFSSWTGDLSSSVLNSNSENALSSYKYPFSSFFEGLNNQNNDIIQFHLTRYGNLTAVFEKSPPIFEFTIPPQTLIEIFIISISAIVTLFIPSLVRWIISKKHNKYLNKYMTKIYFIYDTSQKKDESLNQLNTIRREIDETFAKGQLSESHYQILINKISDYEEKVKGE